MINNKEIKDIIDTLLNSIQQNNYFCQQKVFSIQIKCPSRVYNAFFIEEVKESDYSTYYFELTFMGGEKLICSIFTKCCFLKVKKIPVKGYEDFDEPVRLVGKGKTIYHKQLIKEIKQAFIYKGLWQ